MNELDKALARLKDLGATPQEMDEYTREFMASKTAPADATSALQRERPDASGDIEAVGPTALALAGTAASFLPAGRAVKAVGGLARSPAAARVGKTAVAMLDKVPIVNTLTRAPRAGLRAWKAGKTAEKVAPKSLDDIVGHLDLIPEAVAKPAARTIEEAIEQAAPRIGDIVRNASPVKQRGAPKAQFDYFAERMAQRAAKQAEGAAEPALEDLLALSLDHIKKGGSMKSASDALKLVRRQ